VIDAPFAYAFTAGLVATVNPCGFAMLPAYLSFFLGIESRGEQPGPGDRRAAMVRALTVGITVSLGFLVVFGVIGTLFKIGMDSFIEYVQWATVVIGLGLVALGVAMLCGWHLPVTGPRLDRGGRTRSLGSVLLFGVSYAIASIGCAWPLFFAAVFGTVSRQGVLSGVATFGAYSLGMALVLTALTVALAFARESVVQGLRRAMRYVDRIAAVFLIVAGGYLAYYWTWNKATDYGGGAGARPITFVEDWSQRIQNKIIHDWGYARVGVVLAAVVAVAAAAVVLHRRRRQPEGVRTDSVPVLQPSGGEPKTPA